MLKELRQTYIMGTGNLKTIVIAITAAFSAMLYTKKRIRKENKLKALHSKADNKQA